MRPSMVIILNHSFDNYLLTLGICYQEVGHAKLWRKTSQQILLAIKLHLKMIPFQWDDQWVDVQWRWTHGSLPPHSKRCNPMYQGHLVVTHLLTLLSSLRSRKDNQLKFQNILEKLFVAICPFDKLRYKKTHIYNISNNFCDSRQNSMGRKKNLYVI